MFKFISNIFYKILGFLCFCLYIIFFGVIIFIIIKNKYKLDLPRIINIKSISLIYNNNEILIKNKLKIITIMKMLKKLNKINVYLFDEYFQISKIEEKFNDITIKFNLKKETYETYDDVLIYIFEDNVYVCQCNYRYNLYYYQGKRMYRKLNKYINA